jgi:hypothetical protein
VDQPEPGSIVGHYKIVRTLGAGGMGVVYEAEDMKLGRHVALKMLSGSADHAALERFWREARAVSALNHPGICTLYEINESQTPPFLVMELLEGQSLDRLYGHHPVPLARLIELGVQIADALDAAHRKGILHRDIKPANIFVTDSGQPKILDFGLARFDDRGPDETRDGLSDRHLVTTPGSTLGTIAYMSPEQARGEPLDVRSDVFSLGVVLYEMGTGRHPFEGTTTAIVFDKLLNYLPPAPNSFNHDLPPEFESIITKALEKDRDLRYQSAADLRADLRRLQRVSSAARVVASGVGLASTSGYPGMARSSMAAAAVQSAPPEAMPAPSAAPAAEQPYASNLDVSATIRAGGIRKDSQPSRPALSPIRLKRAWLRYALVGVAGFVIVFSVWFAFFHHQRVRSVAATAASAATMPPAPAVARPQAGNGPSATATGPPAAAAEGSTTASAAKASPESPNSASARRPRESAAAKPAHPVEHAATAPPPAIQIMQPPAGPSAGTAAKPSAAVAATPAPAPATHPAESTSPPHPAAPAAAAGVSYSGRHMHSFPFLNGRSCDGNLELTPTELIFTGEAHSVTLTRAAISGVDGNTVIETGGKKWRFEIYGMSNTEVHNILIKWWNGGH